MLLGAALLLAAVLSPDGIGKEPSGSTVFNVKSPPVDFKKCVRGLRRVSPTFYAGVHYLQKDNTRAELTLVWMTAVSFNVSAAAQLIAPQVPRPEGGECCVVLLDELRLRSDTAAFINPANTQGLSPSFTLGAFLSANDQVRSALGEPKTFIKGFHLVNEAMTTDNNGRNEIFFAELTNVPGSLRIVAISIVYFSCTDFDRATDQCVGELAVETHKIIFNVKDFTFGDATHQAQLMDLPSIAAHEFLHPQGLGDFSGSSCREATMFATVGTGETNKRSFHSSDVRCLQSLYEEPLSAKATALTLIGLDALSVLFALCTLLS